MAQPPPPPPDAVPTSPADSPPAPPVGRRPDPLSFGPPESSGPLVSPAVAAYRPAPPPGAPSSEPPTASVTPGPPTPPTPESPTSGPAAPWAPPGTGTTPASDPATVPVSAAPVTSTPVPSPPPPAAYYPPPAYPATHGYPAPGYPGYHGYPSYPGYPAYPAIDPVTGLPYSDKNKLVAGLLQLLPGLVLAIGGIGRLYAGNTALGVTQLILSMIGWICLICLSWLIVPIVIFVGLWVWFWVDGIVMLAGRPVDGQGRPLP